MRGIARIKRTYRRLRRRLVRGAVILMYHRVANLPQDPYLLSVSPDNFAAHLHYLQETCTVLTLEQLAAALDQRQLPQRPVAVTFDDGYIDTYTQALPVLRAAKVPATVFVASGQVGARREYWWDNLERIFLLPDSLPDQLSLIIGGWPHAWTLASPADRERVRSEIYSLVKPLPGEAREAVLDQLASWAGLSLEGRAAYHTVDQEMLGKLASDPFITIGAHTVTHAALAHLPLEKQEAEISTSRAGLEAMLGGPVTTFAYPYGKAEDFTQETARLVQAAGFQLACSSIRGSLEPGADRFQLKRCGVHNWPSEVFRRNLESFFAL